MRSRKLRKSRKMAALVTAAALTGGLTAPVSAWAADAQSKSVDLKTEVTSTYTLKIPAATTITFNKTSTGLNGVLKVSGNVDVGETVTVTATPNALNNESHKENLPYTLMNGETVFETATWSETELRAGLEGTGKELQLSIAITEAAWKAAKAGNYEGSITFKAELK